MSLVRLARKSALTTSRVSVSKSFSRKRRCCQMRVSDRADEGGRVGQGLQSLRTENQRSCEAATFTPTLSRLREWGPNKTPVRSSLCATTLPYSASSRPFPITAPSTTPRVCRRCRNRPAPIACRQPMRLAQHRQSQMAYVVRAILDVRIDRYTDSDHPSSRTKTSKVCRVNRSGFRDVAHECSQTQHPDPCGRRTHQPACERLVHHRTGRRG